MWLIAILFFCFTALKVLLHKAIFPATRNATDDESNTRQVAESCSTLQLISQPCEKKEA